MIIKLLSLLFIISLITGCANWDTIPGGSFNKLDKETLVFLDDSAQININDYGQQSLRNGRNQNLTDTAIMVTASGGGQRAAAYTMGVLYELQELRGNNKHLNMLSEIDYFSTVSGGGWAVGAYLTEVLKHNKVDDSPYILNSDALISIKSGMRKLNMSIFSNCLIDKIEDNLTSINGEPVKFNNIFVSKNEIPVVPYLFSNATIASNHSPFVFEKEYIKKYQVKKFEYCGNSNEVEQDIGNVPISVALGTSSSVPGFRHTNVTTDLCSDEKYKMSFMCRHKLNHLALFDGGVYDNLGYKTAMEVLSKAPEKNKVLIIIDANADTLLPVDEEKNSDWLIFINTGMMSTLSANAETARKYLRALSEYMGIKVVILKFSDVADIVEKRRLYKERTGEDPLNDLEQLKVVANKEIECEIKSECENNLYYRMGLFAKTSHAIGPNLYDAIQDVGRLTVRLRTEDLLKSIDNNKHNK